MNAIQPYTYLQMPCLRVRHSGYEAVICPQMGANCLQLTVPDAKASLLRAPASLQAYHENPNVYGIPLLFPPNRIADGRYASEGVQYVLPINEPNKWNHIHGFLSRMPFTLTHQHADAACAMLQFAFEATNEVPYITFPHRFLIQIQYTLSSAGLWHQVTVENKSDRPMTFGLGLHTTFHAPFCQDGDAGAVRLHVPSKEEWALDTARILPTGQRQQTPVQLALNAGTLVPAEHRLSALLTRTDAPIRIEDTQTGLAIEYTLDAAYPFVMVYNANQSDTFLCCEPQSWVINAPNVDLPGEVTGVLPLAPGTQRSFGSRIRLA